MTSDGSEYRFWVYADTANENRYVSDTGSVFELRTEHHRPGRSSTPSAPPPATPPTPTPLWAPTRPAGPSTASCSTSPPTPTRSPSAHDRRRHLDAAQVRRRRRPTPSPCVRPPTAPPRPTCSSAPTRTPTCGSTTWPTPTAASSSPTPPLLPLPPRCSPPTRPADTGGSIDLSWSAATDNVGVTGYKLYRGTAPGVYGAPTALGNVTTYTDTTAVTGTRYYYAVAAVDAAGNEGAKSPESSAIAVDNSVVPPAGFDGTFESGTDGAAAHRPAGRSRAPRSAPSTTPPAPRTARCRAGSRARPPQRPQAPRFPPS